MPLALFIILRREDELRNETKLLNWNLKFKHKIDYTYVINIKLYLMWGVKNTKHAKLAMNFRSTLLTF